jgi:hypothetical protein
MFGLQKFEKNSQRTSFEVAASAMRDAFGWIYGEK